MKRRESLKYLGLGSLGAGLVLEGCEPKEARQGGQAAETHAHDHGASGMKLSKEDEELLKQKFFTDHEMKTVTLLADIILPKDEHSGSASEAGVPAFINFMMLDQPQRQTGIRGGLAWLHNRCLRVHGKDFLDSTDAQRTAILDEIAYPRKAKPEVSPGVAFFNSFRDLVATGFWTSKIGVKDLQYMGNVPVGKWEGCPDEVCQKLGVSHSA